MVSNFSRLNESVKNIITMDRREKIMWGDLDAIKQEYLNMEKHLTDKVNIHYNRMIEFEVRVARLEDHFSENFDKMSTLHDKLF